MCFFGEQIDGLTDTVDFVANRSRFYKGLWDITKNEHTVGNVAEKITEYCDAANPSWSESLWATLDFEFSPDTSSAGQSLFQLPSELSLCLDQLADHMNARVSDLVNTCQPKLGFVHRVRVDYYRKAVDLLEVVKQVNKRNLASLDPAA